MKVKELRELLNHIPISNDDWEIMVKIKRKGQLGASPAVRVSSILRGFDWDDGRLMVYPVVDLQELEEAANAQSNHT